jgi:hypothetical protein
MSPRLSLNIAVGRGLIRVDCIRGAEQRWTLEAEHDPGTTALGDELSALLSKAPEFGRTRPMATISLDESRVQVRRLEGFPAVDDPETRAQILCEGVRRWFLMRPGGLLTAGPLTHTDGSVWAAAFERSAVDELRAAAATAGIQVTRVVPDPALVDERCGGAIPLAWTDRRWEQRPVPAARARRALIAITVGSAILLGAYPTALWHTHIRLAESASASSVLATRNARLAVDLAAVTSRLDAIADWREYRMSWVSVLASLSTALPAGTAAVTLRADSTTGVLVVVGPRAGSVVDALEAVADLGAPVLVGPVTSEMIGGEMMERATIGFSITGRGHTRR